jgi:hypothetical protein
MKEKYLEIHEYPISNPPWRKCPITEPISKVVRIQKPGFGIKPNLSSNSILSPVF